MCRSNVRFDVVAIGELLIDLTQSGKNEAGNLLMAVNPGGAPANVLAMVAKLGCETAFIGKVGDDPFGHMLKDTLIAAGIDVTALSLTLAYNTTLAVVHLDETGDRTFSFYRKPGADMMLEASELPGAMLADCGVLHFGSVSLSDGPAATATLEAVKRAKSNGALISCDVNYRPLLWDSAENARRKILTSLPLADLLKVSQEEMEFLTDETEPVSGAQKLATMGPAAVLVTMGADGAFFYTQGARGYVPTWKARVVDTTGSGDAFMGAILAQLRGKTPDDLAAMDQDRWRETVRFANACGTLTTKRSGAIPALPDREQVLRLLCAPLDTFA